MKIIFILLLGLSPVFLEAQNPNGNYNPYVNQGIIFPSPLWPIEENGTGVVSFNIGNTGSDALEVFTDHYITLTITLSYGEPDHADPLSAVAGTSAGLFSWSYSSGTYTGIQIAVIPSNSTGTITIAYKVLQNSSSPGSNGFNVNITPAPYQTTSNTQNDDAVSSYTFTEVRDFGDAPASYGSAYHKLDFENYLGSVWDGEIADQPSVAADGDDTNGQDDEDGVTFPALIRQGESLDISVSITGIGRLNAWVDWNGDGDFTDAGERIADNVVRSDGTEDLAVTVPAGATTSAPTYARFRFTPGALSSSSGSANGGEIEDYRITISASHLAPTVPTGLTINSFSENSVSISWNASTDNVGVTGYRIYRGGTFLGTSSGLTYTDNTVSAGNSYTYTVSAINAASYESAQSSPVTVSINDTTPPTIPTGLNVTSVTGSAVSLSWDASTDNVGVTGYWVYRLGSLLEMTAGLTYTDNTVTAGNSYSYTVSAIDAAGNESARSSEVTVNTNDTVPPVLLISSINIVSDGGVSELVRGETLQFTVDILPDNAANKEVIWRVLKKTGDARIMQTGLLVGDSEGTVDVIVITRDGSGKRDTMEFTITSSVLVEAISVTTTSGEIEIDIGDTLQFVAEILPLNATNKHVLWQVENLTGEATISQSGLLKAVEEGSVDVIVSAQDGSGIDCVCSVTINGHTVEVVENEESKISVYPNPGSGMFHISMKGITADLVQIIGYNGAMVMELIPESVPGIIPVNLSNAPPGPYLIRIYSKQGIFMKRIIVVL